MNYFDEVAKEGKPWSPYYFQDEDWLLELLKDKRAVMNLLILWADVGQEIADENRPRVLPDGTYYVTDVRLKRFARDFLKFRGYAILIDSIEGRTTNLTGRVAHYLVDEEEQRYSEMIYDPVHLQVTRDFIKNTAEVLEEDVLELSNCYFQGMFSKKDMKEDIARANSVVDRWKRREAWKKLAGRILFPAQVRCRCCQPAFPVWQEQQLGYGRSRSASLKYCLHELLPCAG